MAHSTAEEWKINTGNQIVYSVLVDAKKGPMKGHDLHIHNNSPLLPYVGQPGWVIEAPEWAATNTTTNQQVARWIPCTTHAELLWKLLRMDTSLYRARWTQPSKTNQRTVLYPDATVRGEDFGWDFTQIIAVLNSGDCEWYIERLDVSSEDNRLQWSRAHLQAHDWNRDLVCHRLVEAV